MLIRWVVLLSDVMYMHNLGFLLSVVRALLNVENLIILHQAPIWVTFWQKTLPITLFRRIFWLSSNVITKYADSRGTDAKKSQHFGDGKFRRLNGESMVLWELYYKRKSIASRLPATLPNTDTISLPTKLKKMCSWELQMAHPRTAIRFS